MILDLEKFARSEQPHWKELEVILSVYEGDSEPRLTLDEVRNLHYLYERASSGLNKVSAFGHEPQLQSYLEGLVARAYAAIHQTRDSSERVAILRWFRFTVPQTFRRHLRAFELAAALTLLGAILGGFALSVDPYAKEALVPSGFAHVMESPEERVAKEESIRTDQMAGQQVQFSAFLMRNNIRVSFLAMALGVAWGIFTCIILVYNGALLGMVAWDYITAGETEFLLGWLLPHGSVEIPAILIGGQAGFIIAGAVLGWGSRQSLRARFRNILDDLITLVLLIVLLLIWAGIIESFFSQYHEPLLPYSVKIFFGATQLAALFYYLLATGKDASAISHARS
jgi:uncharacterized membrane protein SpoIIM required for sporulation